MIRFTSQRQHSGAAGILWIHKQRAGDLPCQRAQDDHNTVARVFFFIIVIENKISFIAIKPLLTEEILGKGITVSASDPWLLCWSWLSKNSRLVRRTFTFPDPCGRKAKMRRGFWLRLSRQFSLRDFVCQTSRGCIKS